MFYAAPVVSHQRRAFETTNFTQAARFMCCRKLLKQAHLRTRKQTYADSGNIQEIYFCVGQDYKP
jgi:hypothetical protein